MSYAKYRNRKVDYDGKQFDSGAECQRYIELTILLAAGIISELECQTVYEILPAFVDAVGKRFPAAHYTPDFRYHENGKVICEDVKGMVTDASNLRMKLFRYRYRDIELRVVKARYNNKKLKKKG
jgi:hypothetical protein